MALFGGPRKPPSFPSGRYTLTNPLRREYGLRLLTGAMPDPLRLLILSAWRRPYLFTGQETPLAVQSAGARATNGSESAGTRFPQAPAAEGAYRQRPDEETVAKATARTLLWFTLTELEVSRRVLEAPIASISRVTRNTLLVAQGAYLRLLYTALVRQVGEAAALAEFARLIARS